MANSFQGASRALTADGLAAASDSLSVKSPEVWTVLAVETQGCGYLGDRRPPILYDAHFQPADNGQFNFCDVSNPVAGGYGATGSHDYDRLADAIGKDRTAALHSASWGMPQIMGENFAAAGFADAESMVEAMCESEDAQLAAFVAFLKANRLDRYLQSHDWTSLAKGYDGPSYVENQYDTELAAQFQKYSAGPLPALDVRSAQMYLTFAGHDPGPIDARDGRPARPALTPTSSSTDSPDRRR